MPVTDRTLKEIVRLGEAIYHDRIRTLVESDNKGKAIAIDIDSGGYEIAEVPEIASDRLLERLPMAEVFLGRIGHEIFRRVGWRIASEDFLSSRVPNAEGSIPARIPLMNRLSGEETVRLGKVLYEERIRPLVEDGNRGMVIAIEVDGGDYEIDDSALLACHWLRKRVPNAEIYCNRIGYPTLRVMGGRTLPGRT